MSSCEGVGYVRLPAGHRQALPDARRADPDELQREIALVSHSPIVSAVLGVADAILLVLNAQRQVVAFNSRVAEVTRACDVLGRRPGEAFECVNARPPGGCGSTSACETCGALGAILACQRSRRSIEAECLIRREAGKGGALEFNVRATPVAVGERMFTVVSLRDISGEKRRQALEQIFFHDVLNTVSGLRSWTAVLQRAGGSHPRASARLDALSRQLERDIRDQQALLLAESGALVPSPARVRAADLLRDVDAVFSSHFAAEDRRLELDSSAVELEVETDPSLAVRVLVNMVRNALEATPPGGAVRVRCDRAPGPVNGHGGRARFSVHNGAFIPPEIQAHVFQRSFSTKAERGRGLGTYSMKLLGEIYLHGEVTFTSEVGAGTTFVFDLPLEFPRAPPPPATQK